MSRLMSVAMTTDAVIERRKTVTRRTNWWEDKNGRRLLKIGDTLTLCRKVQGRKPGEPIERLAEVEVVDIRREPLGLMLTEPNATTLEGFPDLGPVEFVTRFFVQAQGIHLRDDVTRIEWKYIDDCLPCSYNAACDRCEERMCDINGPEARACWTTCVDCPCDCTPCGDARHDERMELLCQLERDALVPA